jgi:hypothetical protein
VEQAAPEVKPTRRRAVAATATTTTGRAPVTAPAEQPARKSVRRTATGESRAAESTVKPAAVKSTSSKTATGRAPARKTATAPVEPPPPEQKPPPRRRSSAKAQPAPVAPAPERPVPALSGPESHEPPSPPPSLTRGILELAAERVAASRPRPAEPEPPAPADGDPMAAPGAHVRPRATGSRRVARSRPAEATPWDGPAVENGWLGTPEGEIAPEPSRTDYAPPEDQYPRTMNRGLPPSVRLPAELPDNLWPPRSMLERNLAENIHVPAPAPAPPRIEDPWEDEPPEPAEMVPDEHLYVAPPERHRSTVEVYRETEPETDFLPSVLEHPETGYVPAHSRTAGPARHAVAETVAARRVRRRRRTMLVAYLLVVVVIFIVGHELRDDEQPLAPGREAAQRADEPQGVGPAAGPVPQVTGDVPAKTTAKGKAGEFGYARERGPILGDGGRLYRFRVAVEKNVAIASPTGFADAIDETLGDERSWINDGRLRLRRVPKADDADFTIYLASAKTSEKMCATGGLDTEGYTSCRVPGQVIINAERWADAVPEYDGKLDTYRRYTINHEVGHELGHGHEACPGQGEKAPVMQQQTFGLKGCTPNAWPYLDGERYAGKPIA